MEKSVMYSTDMIRKFPKNPVNPILFVVYNEQMVPEARFMISVIHGDEYLDHVTIVPLNTQVDDRAKYDVYIDPTAYKYMHSWNN